MYQRRYGQIRRNPWRKLALVEKSYGARRTGSKPAEECSLNRFHPTAGSATFRPSLTLADDRQGQVPGGISIQQMDMATPLKATTTKGQLLSRSSRRWRSFSWAGPSSIDSMEA